MDRQDYMKAYRQANKEKAKEYRKKWRQAHKDEESYKQKTAAYQKQYYANRKELRKKIFPSSTATAEFSTQQDDSLNESV